MWTELAFFPWGDIVPGAPPWLIKHRSSGLQGRSRAWGTQLGSPWPQPEHSRGPEMVTGDAWQQGQSGESRGGRGLSPLISEFLSLNARRDHGVKPSVNECLLLCYVLGSHKAY